MINIDWKYPLQEPSPKASKVNLRGRTKWEMVSSRNLLCNKAGRCIVDSNFSRMKDVSACLCNAFFRVRPSVRESIYAFSQLCWVACSAFYARKLLWLFATRLKCNVSFVVPILNWEKRVSFADLAHFMPSLSNVCLSARVALWNRASEMNFNAFQVEN